MEKLEQQQNFKNLGKLKGKISIFKDSNGVRILKRKDKNELYCIQEEREGMGDKNNAAVYDSFVTSTQDTKDNKGEGGSGKRRRRLNKYEDLFQANKNELDAFVTKKMKRTDGFIAFKPSIGGGNSSNSLLSSSSINNPNGRADTTSDVTHQTTSTASDQAKINKVKKFKMNQNKINAEKEKVRPGEAKSKYKSRNKNNGICSKNTEPGVGMVSQQSSSSYIGFKTLYTTNFT